MVDGGGGGSFAPPSSSPKAGGSGGDKWSVLKNALLNKNKTAPANASSSSTEIDLSTTMHSQVEALFKAHRSLMVEVVFNTRSDRDTFVSLFQC